MGFIGQPWIAGEDKAGFQQAQVAHDLAAQLEIREIACVGIIQPELAPHSDHLARGKLLCPQAPPGCLIRERWVQHAYQIVGHGQVDQFRAGVM